MISNLYSDRNKPNNVEEVIIFDELPKKLRVQFNFILGDIWEVVMLVMSMFMRGYVENMVNLV